MYSREMKIAGIAAIAAVVAAGFVAFGVLTVAMAFGGWPGMGEHMSRMHGGGRDASGEAQTSGGASVDVAIEDFTYAPGNLRVPVGATVTWTNRDSAPHTATARDKSWDTGTLSKGERSSLTFDEPGEYAYYCTIHPDMKARLEVR
jgi:plastocyanin